MNLFKEVDLLSKAEMRKVIGGNQPAGGTYCQVGAGRTQVEAPDRENDAASCQRL